MLSSLSVTWRWKDIGFCGESGILFKLLRSFSPSTPHLQPLLGNMGTFVQSELGVLRESLGRAQEPYFLFLFCTITKKKIFFNFLAMQQACGNLSFVHGDGTLIPCSGSTVLPTGLAGKSLSAFIVHMQSHWRPLEFCPGGSQPGSTPSYLASWSSSKAGRETTEVYGRCSGRSIKVLHLPSHPPNLSGSRPWFWGVAQDTHLLRILGFAYTGLRIKSHWLISWSFCSHL